MSYAGLRSLLPKNDLINFAVLALILVVVLPLSLDIFRLNLVGKYLTYAFVALGLVLCWGYGGILSLGQGVFFCLGGYAMAMFLKLEASSPENTAIQSTPGIPDFMDWLNKKGWRLTLTAEAYERLGKNALDNRYGARSVRRLVRDAVEAPLASFLLQANTEPSSSELSLAEGHWQSGRLIFLAR